MKSKKILVTGGTGYIGSHTAIELTKAGYDLEILDNLSNSKIEVLDQLKKITGRRPKFHKVDLLDKDGLNKVFSQGDFDAVIHFAGLKAVAESIKKPLSYYETNVFGTINLLKSMKKYGVKNIIFSSSATVYGEQKETRLVETMQTGNGITNPYGRTKYMIEEILKDITISDNDFSATILRYFNPIGAHESGLIGEDPNGIPNNLMPIIMKVKTGKIPQLNVYGNDYDTKDGSCVRDFIHVMDLARGHILALQKAEPGVKIYNLGTGQGTSVLELISAFEKVSGEKLNYKIVGRRPGDLAEIFADASLAEAELGFKTQLTVEDAMRDTLRYLANRN